MLTEATLKALTAAVDAVLIGAQLVKGRATPVTAYKIACRDGMPRPQPSRTRPSPARRATAHPGWGGHAESQAALTVRGVRKTFEAENAPVRALRGVDLTMATGEFVAIMGPSGCGKSTLLNLVAGLDTADEGEISVAGEEVTGRSEDDLARHAPPPHRASSSSSSTCSRA